MITIEQALEAIERHTRALPSRAIALEQSLDLILAEDVSSPVDSPPYDKALVDGFALRSADIAAGRRRLRVIEQVTAGQVPQESVGRGEAIRIMTGAPMPSGADAVVMVEDTAAAAAESEEVDIAASHVEPGQFVLRRGAALRQGAIAVHAGRSLGPPEIGLLAEMGLTEVPVIPRPEVAIVATGNELVPADRSPVPGQIRNSNGPMLVAATRRAGGIPRDLGIATDRVDSLAERVARGLESDVLLLSGGVSAGVLDLVPKVLETSGVEAVFHKVRIRPGKPLWFGMRRRDERTTLVFGLPGNPVSSFVCFEVFVRHALEHLRGCAPRKTTRQGILDEAFTHAGPRPTFQPCRVRIEADRWYAAPLRWQSSADLATVALADGLIELPAGDYTLPAGQAVTVRLL